jgi:hypothetical protein
VKPISEDEMFRVMKTGKRKKKQWKRMVTKVTFVGDSFVRKPPKYERFIRPTGLRFKKAHVTHPDLKVGTACFWLRCCNSVGDVFPGHYWREEESLVADLHRAGRDYQGGPVLILFFNSSHFLQFKRGRLLR